VSGFKHPELGSISQQEVELILQDRKHQAAKIGWFQAVEAVKKALRDELKPDENGTITVKAFTLDLILKRVQENHKIYI
jgi:hypothetical protein